MIRLDAGAREYGEVSGARLLWQTVLLRAVMDATAPFSRRRDHEVNKASAGRWIGDCGRDFRLVCHLAGVDPEFLSERFRAGQVDGCALRGDADVHRARYERAVARQSRLAQRRAA